MELNKKASRKTVVNPEGSRVLERRPEIQAYLEGANLRIKSSSFYKEAEDKLKTLLNLSKEIDEDYVLGLAKFLADKGLKLSPVVLLSVLSSRGFSFRFKTDEGVPIPGKQFKNVKYVFNTPARIAESFALYNLKLVHLNNSFRKHILKEALEEMNELTLRKNKMARRKVKLADLIKILRAKPKTPQLNKLYKAIIESSNEASLKDTENIVSIKSSTKLEEEEKKELIDTNLEKMPINQIIRNLKFLADKYDFKKNIELQQRVIDKLNSVNNYRMLNIFDVIMAAMFVPQFEKALFEVVKKFIQRTREEFKFEDNATLLFDVSGSMGTGGFMARPDNKDGKGLGFMYLILFALLMKNLKLRTFSNNLNGDEVQLKKIVERIQTGSIQEAYKMFNKHFEEHSGGTALLESATELCDNDPEIKNLIIISDEVSWKEGSDLRGSISSLSKKLTDKNLFLINPVVYSGTVFEKNIVAISSLNPSVLIDMAIFLDEKGFIDYIKKYKREQEIKKNGNIKQEGEREIPKEDVTSRKKAGQNKKRKSNGRVIKKRKLREF
jgi:hypothetical protein